VEGDSNPSPSGGSAAFEVRQRLVQIDQSLPSVGPLADRLSDAQTAQLFAAVLSQLTALREVVTFLAVEIDRLSQASAPPS